MLVSFSPILSTISYVFFSLTENLEFINRGIFLSSFNIKFTDPSYDGYTVISTGCFISKFSLSVSKSIKDPALAYILLESNSLI